MKIAILNDDYPPEGRSSVGNVAADLAQGYRDNGHDVRVITTHRTEKDASIRQKNNLWSIPVSYRRALRHYHCLYSPRVSRMLRTLLAEMRPDAVHAHNVHMYLTYDALRIARKHTHNVILTLHDVMSFSYSRLATPRYLESEGRETHLTARDHIGQVGLQWNPFRNMWIRHVLRTSVTHLVAVSKKLADAIHTNGLPMPGIIHHGINISRWNASPQKVDAFRKRFKLDGRKVILFGGRVSIDKGIEQLVHALNSLRQHIPNLTLLILGEERRLDGMLTHAGLSKEEANDLMENHIIVTEWTDRETLPAAYAAADLVTTPSLCLDTFNLMNLEAMAAGKPVVGTIFGGTPEIVVDGVTGFVRSPLDLPAYTEALRKLLLNPGLAETMGKAGQQRAKEHFPLNRKVEEYLRLFASE